jgi:hypothetical protein
MGTVGYLEDTDRVTETTAAGVMKMFAFNRSAIAVLVPLALLVAVVLLSNQEDGAIRPQQAQVAAPPEFDRDQPIVAQPHDQTVAANLPSR